MNKIKKILKKQGFTLVELIIVIAIIAVLAVAAFMMLTKWLGKSRDSRKLADIETISKSLMVWLNDLDNTKGQVPVPDNEGEILFDGTHVFTQGIFGSGVVEQMQGMQKAPVNPSSDAYYKYSRTIDGKKYQLATELEDGKEVTALVNMVNAGERVNAMRGNFNPGIYLFATGTNVKAIYLPSIIGAGVISGSDMKTNSNFVLDGENSNLVDTLGNIEQYEDMMGGSTPLDVVYEGPAEDMEDYLSGMADDLGAMMGEELTEQQISGMLLAGGTSVAAPVDETTTPTEGQTEPESTGETVLLIHSDDSKTSYDPDDHFDDSDINLNKWSLSDTNATSEIISNRYVGTIVGQSERSRSYIKGNDLFKGDFDVQINTGIISKSGNNFMYGGLLVFVPNEGLVILRASAINNVFESNIGHWNGSSWEWDTQDSLSKTGLSDVGNSTALRVVRLGNILITYGWNGSGWTEIDRFSSWTTNDAYFQIMGVESVSTFPDCSAWVDNFQVNKGTVISNVMTDSATSKAITVSGGVYHSSDTSIVGDTSIYFDGDGDYLSIADSDDWDFGTGDFTVDFWANAIDLTDENIPVLIGRNTGPGTNYNMWIYLKHNICGGNLCAQFRDSNDIKYLLNTSVVVSNDGFHHYTLVRDSNLLILYVDGLSVGQVDIGISFANDDGIGFMIGGDGAENYITGYIDEFKIIKGEAVTP